MLQELKNITPDGTVFEEYIYTYDAANNMTSKTEMVNGVSKGTTSYTYDVLNRLKTVTEPNGRVTVYTFDASNRIIDYL